MIVCHIDIGLASTMILCTCIYWQWDELLESRKKHSSAWFSLLGWFQLMEPDPEQPIADIFKLGISLEKDFFLTITKTKIRAWLHWNSFAKYPLLLLQEWILLTEKKHSIKRRFRWSLVLQNINQVIKQLPLPGLLVGSRCKSLLLRKSCMFSISGFSSAYW